jgi:ribosomal protein S27E
MSASEPMRHTVGVKCPDCNEQAIELGSGTAVTCACTCGAMLLISRDSDGVLARREVLNRKGGDRDVETGRSTQPA